MVIDAHTHIHKNDQGQWETQRLLNDMDQAGIDMALVISNHVTDAPLDEMLKLVENQPHLKLIGNVEFATFDQQQIDKLKNLLQEKKILGVKLYPGYEDFYPYDEKLHPLLEFMQENGYPLVIHTGIMLAGYPGYMEQTHPLAVDKLATKFPKLKIVMAHVGNPWIMDAAAVVSKNPNIYTDFSGFFTEHLSPIPQEEIEVFVRFLKDFKVFTSGFKKCMFGTDWPHYNLKEYLAAVMQLPMTDEEKDLVLYKTAQNVYNLN